MATDPISENSGFRMFDIWDLGALRFIILIAKANADTQVAWGSNTNPVISNPATGGTSARAVFKGTTADPQVFIDDISGCAWEVIHNATVSSNKLTLIDPASTISLSFGDAETSRYTLASSAGWIRDILDCPINIGDDTHDLMELFLPKEVTSNEGLSSFPDYHTPGSSVPKTIFTGGTPSLQTKNGLFISDLVGDIVTTPAKPATGTSKWFGCGHPYRVERPSGVSGTSGSWFENIILHTCDLSGKDTSKQVVQLYDSDSLNGLWPRVISDQKLCPGGTTFEDDDPVYNHFWSAPCYTNSTCPYGYEANQIATPASTVTNASCRLAKS